MSSIGVLVVDDHRVFVDVLSLALSMQPDVKVVGTTGDGKEAVKLSFELHPDVVLMDFHLPGLDGITATQAIKANLPDCKVVMLTSDSSEEVLVRAIEAGVSGYLTKERAASEVMDAVRRAHQGEILIPPAVLVGLLSRLAAHARGAPAPAGWALHPDDQLTPREREVLGLLARGLDNPAICDVLVISPNTLRTHLQNIFRKLEAHSKLEAVTIGLRRGLIEAPK